MLGRMSGHKMPTARLTTVFFLGTVGAALSGCASTGRTETAKTFEIAPENRCPAPLPSRTSPGGQGGEEETKEKSPAISKRLSANLKERRSKIKSCYEEALETDSSIEGAVRFHFHVKESGGVHDVRACYTEIHYEPFIRCIENELSSVDVGELGVSREISVLKTFNFAVGSKPESQD
jgi:hypothetical protein